MSTQSELEMMTYYQFKKVWLGLVDVRVELRNRREPFNRFLPNSVLVKKLEQVVSKEEKQEALTLLEADNSLEDERIAKQRRDLVEEALLLSRAVLSKAIDAAGQVYFFGSGLYSRLDGDVMQPDNIDFMDYEVVKDLWQQRVRPSSDYLAAIDPIVHATASVPQQETSHVKSIEPATSLARAKLLCSAAANAFAGRQISLLTSFLWGKRVKQVACGPAVGYALTDAGEVFCWGGNKRQWRYFYDDVTLEQLAAKEAHGQDCLTPVAEPQRPLTTRSEMLKLSIPSQVAENQHQHRSDFLCQKYHKLFVKPKRILPTEEEKRQRLERVGRYYDLLPPASSNSNIPTRIQSFQDLMETVEPELNVDNLVLSLQVRGVYLAKSTRLELMEKLGDCIALEVECMDENFGAYMKEQDKIARRLRHDRRDNQMMVVASKTAALWTELRILQEQILQVERETYLKEQREYLEMKRSIVTTKHKIKRQAREGFKSTNAGASVKVSDEPSSLNRVELFANGLTARGPPLRNYDGDHALAKIAVGSRHALAIRQSGKLFTWGVGSFGRLGGTRDGQQSDNNNHPDAWHQDVHAPQVVSTLESMKFREIACGFGHSVALSTLGQVFVWGSATHGKLGVGHVNANESFSLVPIQLSLPSGLIVRKVACGPSHSALLTTDGNLFVWGSGAGGRLGLGDERDVGENRVPRNGGKLRSVDMPTRVSDPFSDEKLVDVSCGTAHTAVLTSTRRISDGSLSGGLVFVAGSSHALGKFMPVFTKIPIRAPDKDGVDIVMIRIGCGDAQTAVVSSVGELFTWGNNAGGCTGHALAIPLVKMPTCVTCLYQRPRNLGQQGELVATMSTQNASCKPEYALSPAEDGNLAQTQQEACPFWQLALPELSRINSVHVMLKIFPEDSSDGVLSTIRPRSAASVIVKYVILVSVFPFDLEERGKYGLAKAKSHSTHYSCSLRENQAEWTWELPVDVFGCFVRVQMESSSSMLSLRNVEIMGMSASEFQGPRVSDIACFEGLTVAICRPSSSVEVLRERFLRAIRVDISHLWILKQLETFHSFVLKYEQARVAKGGENTATSRDCVLCRPKEKCVICQLEQEAFADSKAKAKPSETVAGPLNTLVRGKKLRKIGTKDERKSDQVAVSEMSLEELCQTLLAKNTRTEEEEEEAQRLLELELMDMDALAREKQKEEQPNGGPSTDNALQDLAKKKTKGFGSLSFLFRSKSKSV